MAFDAPVAGGSWPPHYVNVWGWRQEQLERLVGNEDLLFGAREYYRQNPDQFILHWVDTYDPRNAGVEGKMARMPFIPFSRQVDMVQFLNQCLDVEADGLIEKARDMGATWIACAFSVAKWLFEPGISIGWGSRKEALVDKLGDPDSIFEKMRMVIRGVPEIFLPVGFSPKEHMTYMRIVNPETGATITGEAGDNIGRGGRKRIYFKDESAHYERPEAIEAALGDNTRVQIDISSVNGIGNVFYRRRHAGEEWKGEAIKGKTNVFVMDWKDHPDKSLEWYETRRAKAEADGLLHVFAQEVDRDYSAAVDGIVIPRPWIVAAIDAHKKLGFAPLGAAISGLDVADQGGDKNAQAIRVGPMLTFLDSWAARDVGVTTRRAVGNLRGRTVSLQYDSVGVGAGVRSESNRLKIDEDMDLSHIDFVPWSAGAKVLNPKKHLLTLPDGREDKKSPTNEEYYDNLKAQAWWELRLRFERTYKAITEGAKYKPDELISIPKELPNRDQLEKELNQVTASMSTRTLKLTINKKPEGTFSPNLADSVVMAFWPVVNQIAKARMLSRSSR